VQIGLLLHRTKREWPVTVGRADGVKKCFGDHGLRSYGLAIPLQIRRMTYMRAVRRIRIACPQPEG
jgi:hypothetical protein